MAKQCPDRQLGEAEIAGDAAEGVAQRVRRDTLNTDAGAEPEEAGLGRREMAVGNIGREDIRIIAASRLAGSDLRGGRADRTDLRIALGVGESHVADPGVEPMALHALSL